MRQSLKESYDETYKLSELVSHHHSAYSSELGGMWKSALEKSKKTDGKKLNEYQLLDKLLNSIREIFEAKIMQMAALSSQRKYSIPS